MVIVLDLSKLAKTYTSIYMIVQLLYSTSKYIVECAFGPSACNAISAATVYLQSHNLQHDKTIDHYVIFCAGFSTKRREDFWFCGRILPQQQQYRAHRTQRHLAASSAGHAAPKESFQKASHHLVVNQANGLSVCSSVRHYVTYIIVLCYTAAATVCKKDTENCS